MIFGTCCKPFRSVWKVIAHKLAWPSETLCPTISPVYVYTPGAGSDPAEFGYSCPILSGRKQGS